MPRPRVVRIPLEVAYSGADFTMSVRVPEIAKVGVIGLTVDSMEPLWSHQIESMLHVGYEAVTPHVDGGTLFGVPLAHVASHIRPRNYSSADTVCRRFKPWPGRYGDFSDFDALRIRLGRGDRLRRDQELRLQIMARGDVHVESFALWRLEPMHDFVIKGKRLHGSAEVGRAYLICLMLDDVDYDVLCDGRMDYIDRPHWFAHGLSLAAASGVEPQVSQRIWQGGTLPHYGIDVWQTFALAHEDDSGLAYHPASLDAALVRWSGGERERIYPSFADQRQVLSEHTTQLLQEFDPTRRANIWVPWRSSLNVEVERLTTTNPKVVRMSHYGLLRHSNDWGEIVSS